MEGERRSLAQTGITEMGLTGTLEKPAAAKTTGGAMRLELVEAGAAQDLFSRSLEQDLTDLTKRWEKDELPELSAPGDDFSQGHIQAVSDSAFCWQSMQYGVQGSAFSLFLLISF